MFGLIPSPLVGPGSWAPVAEVLARRGLGARVATLSDSPASSIPFWQQHAASAAASLADFGLGQPLVLAGHSGAGPLLPAIRQAMPRPVAAYLFVDAGLPAGGQSRLGMWRAEDAAAAAELQAHLLAGGRYPEWSDADLQDDIPDAAARRSLLAEVRPRGLDFFSEPLPAVAGWPDAPCAYLQLSDGYTEPARQARERGWPFGQLAGGHFYLIVQPDAVAEAMLALAWQLSVALL